MPTIRDPDAAIYFKSESNGNLIVGGWEKRGSKTFSDYDISQFEELDSDSQRFEQHHNHAVNLFLELDSTKISSIKNGPVTFTPDGNPIIGWSPNIENMFICTGFTAGIGCAGGVGSFAGEWISEGRNSKPPTHDRQEEKDLK